MEAANVGSNVRIGNNCIIVGGDSAGLYPESPISLTSRRRWVSQGRFVIIKDCVKILDDTVIPANTVIPPYSIYGGNPARFLGEVPEVFQETHEEEIQQYHEGFRLR